LNATAANIKAKQANHQIMNLAHPDFLCTTASVNVRFVSISPFQLQIKHAMKTSAYAQNEPLIPSLFQVASRFEDFVPAANLKSTPPLNQTPFAELMLHPEKLKIALLTAKKQNDAFATSRRGSDRSPNGRVEPNMSGKSTLLKDRSRKQVAATQPGLIKVEFSLEAPFAQSVKLAADFTDWEKFPLDMIKSENGVWHTLVPLPPGDYAYRFIVDGRWCDHPHPARRITDQFRTTKTVMKVTQAQE
jgi:Glycogen recognition site of AMP-activated protein kinase